MSPPTLAYRVMWSDRLGRVRDSVLRRDNLAEVRRSIDRRRGSLLVVRGPFRAGCYPGGG